MTDPSAPFLSAWFEIMDSDTPSRILDLISADFTFSILFSTGGDTATDFSGGRAAMEHYLAQREQGTLTHHRIATARSGPEEFFLGEVRRAGVVEADFVAVGRVVAGKLSHFLIGRSPGVRFETGVPDVQPGAAGLPAT